jgi:FixJ family two-component response regulator
VSPTQRGAAACCPTCGQALPALTPLQQSIAGALAEDRPRQAIADDLGVSLSTVDRVARLVQKAAQPKQKKQPPEPSGNSG